MGGRFRVIWIFLFVLLMGLAADAQEGTPDAEIPILPNDLEVITAENAGGLMVVARIACSCRYIYDLVWSPDGNNLAVASDENVWLFSLNREPANPYRFSRQGGWINDIEFSPDGMWLAAASDSRLENFENMVILWDVTSGEKVVSLEHDSIIEQIGFSLDGKRLFSWAGSHIYVWDTGTFSRISHIEMMNSDNGIVASTSFSPDRKILAVGTSGAGGRTRTFDVFTGELLAKRFGYTVELTFSPDGMLLAGTGQHGGWTDLWNLETQDEIALLYHNHGVLDLDFSPNGALLAQSESFLGFDPAEIRIWNLRACDIEVEYLGFACEVVALVRDEVFDRAEGKLRIDEIAFNPEGTVLASVSTDGYFRLWGVRSAQGDSE